MKARQLDQELLRQDDPDKYERVLEVYQRVCHAVTNQSDYDNNKPSDTVSLHIVSKNGVVDISKALFGL